MMDSIQQDRLMQAVALELPGFSEDERQAVLSYLAPFEQLSAEKGQLMYHYQQPFSKAYLLLDGLVRSYSFAGEQEVNLRFLAAPSLVVPFYSMAEQIGQPRPSTSWLCSESIECVQRCHFMSWPASKLINNLPHNSSAALDNTLFYKLQAYMGAQHYLSMQQRLLMLQHKKAVDRYQFFCSVMPAAVIAGMPDFHIASYLGLTPETLSRVKPK